MAQPDSPLDPRTIGLISFDCYGTLIDWEQGILGVLRVLLAAHGEHPPPEDLLEAYAEFERAAEESLYRPYRQVLSSVIEQFGRRHGFIADPAELDSLARSLPSWKPFDDTVPSLRRLAARYSLAVCSNIDDDLFESTARQLETPFTAVVTAEQVRSYKPSQGHFTELVRRTGFNPREILHVAQSLYHDIAPACTAGFHTVWLHRRTLRRHFGATPESTVMPERELDSLTELATVMEA